jgi:hypothetical protein
MGLWWPSVCVWPPGAWDPPGVSVCLTGTGICGHHCFFSTQNLFGKMADILEKIKK